MNKIKAFFITVFAGMCAFFGKGMAIAIIALVAMNFMDYLTRIFSNAYQGKTIASAESIKGIFKKVSMWLLVCVGFVFDIILKFVANTFSFNLPFNFAIAAAVCAWLIFNEIVSVLENISEMGISIPFLMPLAKYARGKIEEATEIKGGENKDEN